MAARAGRRSSDGGKGRQNPTEALHGVSPQQPTMTRLTSSTTPNEPIPSPPESSPDKPRLPQQARETMQSPAETGQGSPLTTTLPFEGSRIPVIEVSPPSPPPAPQRLPTHSRPTTGTPRSTPGMILALESSTESAARSTQLALPSPSQPTSALTPGGRNSEPAPTSDRPPSPPRSPSQPPAERGQLQEETSEDCGVCYEVLVPPMVHLGSCPHRLHLRCYAALRVRAGTDLRCPACRATVTVGEADRSVSRQHSDEVMEETLAVARHEMLAEGGRGVSARTTRGERGERFI